MANQKMRCGLCGDITPALEMHTCWVLVKIREEPLNTDCIFCGEPEVNGLAHWRCQPIPDSRSL